jgi:hypothetical protein
MRVSLRIRLSKEINDEVREIAEFEKKKVREVMFYLLLRGIAVFREDGIIREPGMGHLYVRPNFNPGLNRDAHREPITIQLLMPKTIKEEIEAVADIEERKISEVAFWFLVRGLKKYTQDFQLIEDSMTLEEWND